MQSNFILSTLYPRVYLYTANDDSLAPLQIHFKALTKRQIDFTRNLTNTNTISYQSLILNESIIKIDNTIAPDGSSIFITPDELPTNIKKELVDLITQVSIVSKEVYDKMKLSIALHSDKKFNTDTWKCDICQERGLDKVRNCKFNKDYEKDYNKEFSLIVDGIEYKDCPMFNRDLELTSAMFECYNLFNVGILPEQGGVADQTEFFSYAISLVAQAQNKKQKEKNTE